MIARFRAAQSTFYAKDKNKMDIEIQMYRKVVDFQKVPNLSNLKVHLQESERPCTLLYLCMYVALGFITNIYLLNFSNLSKRKTSLSKLLTNRYSKILLVVAKSKADVRTS